MQIRLARGRQCSRNRASTTGQGSWAKFVPLDDADRRTTMNWEADVHILGPVGSMGQRVLQPIVNQQVESVLSALDQQVQEAAAAS